MKMKEEARVANVNEDTAEIIITRHSACDKCEKKCGLADSSHDTDQIKVEVNNPINAQKGDLVIVEMDNSNIRLASLLVYLIPIIGLFVGYFFFNYLGNLIDINQLELFGMAGSFIFFGFSWYLLRKIDNHYKRNNSFQPEIVKIKRDSNRYY